MRLILKNGWRNDGIEGGLMKKTLLIALCTTGSFSTSHAALVGSTIDTFSPASQLAAYVPIDGNDASVQTFLPGTATTDGNHLDAADDGYARLHRTGTAKDTIGLFRNIGTIMAADVGRTITIDAALSVPNSNLTITWEILVDGNSVDGQGKLVVNTFSTGNAPGGNTPLLLSTVALGADNPQRTIPGALTYAIQAADVGKMVSLRFSLYDGSTEGMEGTRNVHVDAIQYRILPESDPNPPVFASNPIIGSPATNNLPYAGSLAGLAVDPDGTSLTYSILDGPDWLRMLSDGTLYGSPGAADAGTNAFTVMADNGLGGTGMAILEIDVASVATNVSRLWSEYVAAQQVGGRATLKDYSYAGYHYCAIPIPDITTHSHTWFDVVDFGAVPDDAHSDRNAVLAALAAAHAHAGPSVVYFPPGRFLMKESSDLGKAPLEVKRSHIVIKGAGVGLTELVFNEYSRFGDSLIGFRSSSPAVEDYWRGDKLMSGKAVEQLDDFSVRVDNPTGLAAGQKINFSGIFPSLLPSAAEYFAPHAVPQGIIDRHGGWINDIFEVHTIQSVSNNVVRFGEPIQLELDHFLTNKIYRLDNAIEECGIEDLTLTGGYRGQFSHHNGPRQGEAYRMLGFNHVFNGWARRLRIADFSVGMEATLCGKCTFSDILFEGNAGHNLAGAYRSTGNLFAYIRENTDAHHGLGGSGSAAGTVFLRCTQYGNMEAHCGFIRSSLYDLNEGVFTLLRPGGAVEFPHHDKGLAFWNWNNTQSGAYDFWPTGASYGYFMPPVIAGLHGSPATFADAQTDILALESQGTKVEPESLFEAQLALRMGGLPQWFADQSAAFETSSRKAEIALTSPVDQTVFPGLSSVVLAATTPLDPSQIAAIDFQVSGSSRWEGYEYLPKEDAVSPTASFIPPHAGVWMLRARLANRRGEISYSTPVTIHCGDSMLQAVAASSASFANGTDRVGLYGGFVSLGGGEAAAATGSAVVASKSSTQPWNEIESAFEAERQGFYNGYGATTMAPFLSDAGRIATGTKFFDGNPSTTSGVYHYLDSMVQAVFSAPRRIHRVDIVWSGNAPASGVRLEIQTPLAYPTCLNSVVNDEPLWEAGVCRIGGTLRQTTLPSSNGVTSLCFPERTAHAVRLIFAHFEGTIAELKFFGPEDNRPLDHYLAWASGHGLAGLEAGYGADPDNDHRSNLFEYATGGSPVPGSSNVPENPTVDIKGNQLDFIHLRRRDAAVLGLAYAVEASSDLVAGTWEPLQVLESTSVVDADFEAITNRISIADMTNGFFRLRIDLTE